jgi:hypothetical protein
LGADPLKLYKAVISPLDLPGHFEIFKPMVANRIFVDSALAFTGYSAVLGGEPHRQTAVRKS